MQYGLEAEFGRNGPRGETCFNKKGLGCSRPQGTHFAADLRVDPLVDTRVSGTDRHSREN